VVDGIDMRCEESCVHIPHRQLAAYSEDRLFKRVDVRSNRCAAQAKLCTLDELRGSRAAAVVSGSFDVLHPGHVRLMQQAKAQADVLVVAMQSTSSMLRQPKNRGGDRPIYSEDDRVAVVAALSCVDHVVLFDEPDCASVLDALRPSVYVKHERDRGRTVVEREAMLVRAMGGHVVYVGHSFFDFSSRGIIERLRSIPSS
jgi:rfaE bifunctional protein nucleotidyltransferase chain/domain